MYKGEYFNSISHLVGAIAGLVGLVILVMVAIEAGDPWKIVSFSIYGATLFLMFLTSTLYHSLRGRPKAIFKLLDYHAIYLLIAGTYTPFALITLQGDLGWWLLGAVWTLAVAGIILDIYTHQGRRIPQLGIYLVMGWLIVIALAPLMQELTPWGVLWLFIGGMFYTLGVVFFVLDEKVRHFHGIWHLFVLAGSATHYFTVLHYVD